MSYKATLMSGVWLGVRKWTLPRRLISESDVQEMTCGHFQKKYDKVQGMIQQVGCMDELLSGKRIETDDGSQHHESYSKLIGMLSKSKGQVLRVAAVMHVLFHMDTPTTIPKEISEAAVKAADCFVDLCLQHAAYLGGRGDFQEAVDEIQQGLYYIITGLS